MYSQITLFDGDYPLRIDTKPIRLIELFAGIGSQAKALENLGVQFEHYRICEFDRFAVASYNAVHGTVFERSDITKISASDLGIVDTESFWYIMTYSFPCTDLSKAGKKEGMSRGSGTRSGLLWEVERLLKECEELPQILVMENVPDVISDTNIRDFSQWIAFLDSLGYTSKYAVLNSKDYKIPQNRDRCFMVSYLGNYYYDFPEPLPLDKRLRDLLEKVVDEKFYLSQDQVERIHMASEDSLVYDKSMIGFEGVAREYNDLMPTLTSREYKEPRLINQTKLDGIDMIGLLDIKGNEMIRRVYGTDGLAPTLNTMQGGNRQPKIAEYHSVPGCGEQMRIRKVTPRECWRLMGFSDADYDRAERVNSNSQLYKQAGNSIVVPVLEAIFHQMISRKGGVVDEDGTVL